MGEPAAGSGAGPGLAAKSRPSSLVGPLLGFYAWFRVVTGDAQAARAAAIRRRVTLAKAGLALGGVGVFGAAVILSRANDPGHPKERLRPLAASPSYVAAVHENLGDIWIIRPALSSPTAATHQS